MKLYSGDIAYHVEIHQNRSDRPWLLMLHGFMGSSEVFQPLIHELCECCNPVLLDLLGHGKSGRSEDPDRYRVDRQVEDLHSLLARLQPTPLILYGYSMGGRLALQFTLQYPGWVQGLILESTHPGLRTEKERLQRQEDDEKRASAIEENFENFLHLWQQLPLFRKGGDSESHSGFPPGSHSGSRYSDIMRRQDPKALAASLRGFGTGHLTPVQDKLKTLRMPVLMIAGREDTKYVKLHQKMSETVERSSSVTLRNAAHRVHEDRPRDWLKTIKNFMEAAAIR